MFTVMVKLCICQILIRCILLAVTKTDGWGGSGGGDEHHSKCQWMLQVERSLNLICIWRRWLWLLGVGEGGAGSG